MKNNIKQFCSQNNLTEAQFYGTEKVGGWLYLNGLKEIPGGFNPTVGGWLYLNGLKEIPGGFNPTVGGWLSLDGLKEIPSGFNPTVGGSLYLNGLKEIPSGFNPTVGGSLSLDGLKEIPSGFNPTVGGSLSLDGLKEIPSGFNPTVGGWLYLNGLKEIPGGFNPTVGGSLYTNGLNCSYKQQSGPMFWDNYVLADGMFTKILSKKGNVYKVKEIGKTKEFYLIIEGVVSAHGDTIKKAKEDLDYKIKSESLKNNPVLPDEIITIQRYHAITGACETGIKSWMQQNNASEMPAKDLLPLLIKTEAYGYKKFENLMK